MKADKWKYPRNRSLLSLALLILCTVYWCTACGDKSQVQEKGGGKEQKAYVLDTEYNANYEAIIGSGLGFSIDDTQQVATIISYYDLESEEVTLPDEIIYEGKQYPVTEVGESAFESNQTIKSIQMGSHIETIAMSAFYTSAVLETVECSDALESIGELAFANCPRLRQVEWGDSLQIIGNSAFQGDESLTSLVLPATVTDWGAEVFMDCTGITECRFDEGAQMIGEGMFCNCTALETVQIPDTVTVIGAEAFWNCIELQELVIPDTVLMIGDQALYGTGIQKLRLPERLSGITIGLLDGMAELETIQVPAAKETEYTNVFKYYGLNIEKY